MRGRSAWAVALVGGCLLLGLFVPQRLESAPPETTRVAVWNVRNYLVTDRTVEGRYRRAYPKPEAEKSALRAVIRKTDADVLALQEMGDERFLQELQRDLRHEGLDYPHTVVLNGPDEERHLAVLSRIPFAEVLAHRTLPFRFLKKNRIVKRGLLEIAFAGDGAPWRLFVVHLKSRYSERPDDLGSLEQRNGEATAIRNVVAERLGADPDAAVFVVGDFNDHRRSRPLRRFLAINGRPLLTLLPTADDRGDVWTHYFAREDTYERIDFVLASPAAVRRVATGGPQIPDSPEMRLASDHRMIVFEVENFATPRDRAVSEVSAHEM